MALAVLVTVFSAGPASPASADPEIGDVCNPATAKPAPVSVDFWFQNRTDFTLVILRSKLNQGVWHTAPPVAIGPWEWTCCRNVSSLLRGGASGWVTYALDLDHSIRVTLVWQQQSHGGNGFECRPLPNHGCLGRPGSGFPFRPTPIFQMFPRV